MLAEGGGLGATAGSLAGQLAPKDMPPPAGAPPSGKSQTPQMPVGSQNTIAAKLSEQLQMPGQGGFLKRPFV